MSENRYIDSLRHEARLVQKINALERELKAQRERATKVDIHPFLGDIANEVAAAKRTLVGIGSAHEGYARMMDELDKFWEQVKRDGADRDVERMKRKLVLVAAMAMRTWEDVVTK